MEGNSFLGLVLNQNTVGLRYLLSKFKVTVKAGRSDEASIFGGLVKLMAAYQLAFLYATNKQYL